MKKMEALVIGVGVVAVAVLIGAISAVPVMWLWNWLVTDIFSLREITFLEAWGLYTICNVLFRNSDNQKRK